MLSEADKLRLKQGAEEIKVILDSVAIERFDLFADRLQEENRHLNLTRIPPEKTVTLHFLDSLTLNCAVRIRSGANLLDLGTGAGFPGLPLAIAYPNLAVTLVDATQKRLMFLDRLITELGLDNVRLVHGRAEDLCGSDLKQSFDIVTARAVAKMQQLAGWLIPFVVPSGCAVAYKSEGARVEIENSRNSIQIAGGSLACVKEVKLPGEEIIRLLAVISVNTSVADAHNQRSRSASHQSVSHKEKY